ncbi:hypothetical protein M407DRAFT_21381 [Tulasnella calospora MUT 4182]|uniref:Fungal-type protein kinase domain-containing protein n=1 Tax=Tulasnella calospora MUT 4182 TaxID=1051891 RepID=A0A0C3QN90_9AGAM|nr:hypothetical protein M407DRAFT_21381 [Tulasnella calospora MUT 4182]
MSTERPITPQPTQFSHQSSSIEKGPFYAGHKLDQVQRYHKENHQTTDFKDTEDLFKFLGTPTFDELPDVQFSATVPRSTFFVEANSMSKSIKEEYFKEPSSGLVVFKDTESKVPRGHVTDTQCRPNITAAFEDDFRDSDTTFWPRIRMAGEWASRGSSPEDQETKAISYVHYLLLVRPDLYVAQGMLASEDRMIFLVGIGGFGIRRLEISWDDKELSKLLYAFIYRTYDPDHLADSSYKLDPIIVDKDHPPTWTITIGVKSPAGDVTTERLVRCPNFLPLYASSPFETRTHVFATKGEGVDVDGEKLTVLKDQVCRIGNRFDEHEILELVHNPKRVPGVVEAVYHASIKLPSQLDVLKPGKIKHRHGLRQLGSPFASIPTLKEMLQVAFDIVEVLRFLKAKRNILHRDISIGNVMYAPPSEDKQDPDTSTQDDEVLFFSEFFISDSPRRPHTTSVLLVDFNHGEHLTSKEDVHHKRVERTGTAVFMARAVELGRPVDIPEWAPFLSPIPSAPDRYAKHYHDTRLMKFPSKPLENFTGAVNRADWSHELDHDVESVFWLMLYWAMTARPKGGAAEHIAVTAWGSLTGNFEERQSLLMSLLYRVSAEGTFHSTFRPLDGLFQQLAEILCSIDRHWLHASEKRNDPEYFAEAFQRLILQFLIKHNDDDDNSFMNQTIDSNPRKTEQQSIHVPRSSTTN